MNRTIKSQVLIVGAGPVGLTLAVDLAWRGIDVTIAELRRAGEPPRIRSNHVSARSMEIFRRLGVAGNVRKVGLPDDYPNDVSFRTKVTGIELVRIPIPSRAKRYAATDGPDTWWPTAEPPHRINQIYLEPLLFAHAASQPHMRILHHCKVEDLVQSEGGVVATIHDLDSGDRVSVACAYLVGCDGGKSTVRKKIGANLVGAPVIQRVQSTYIRAPQLLSLISGAPAWHYLTRNPRRCGSVFAIDGRETWIVHNPLEEDEPGYDSIDRDWAIRTILGVRPITEQVSRFAVDLAVKNIAQLRRTPPEIEMPGPIGDAVRAREFYDLNVQQYCCGGLNFGYFYDGSPIIAYDGEPHPTYTMSDFTPSTVPGCRAPHLWLSDGRSLYDALGPEYTLPRFDPAVRVGGLVEAAARRHLPLAVLDVDSPDVHALYARKLLDPRGGTCSDTDAGGHGTPTGAD
jgi:2-polyprenyl-6-methoxyphenol hydroxylase-like FAD-dependent oxidoreductase